MPFWGWLIIVALVTFLAITLTVYNSVLQLNAPILGLEKVSRAARPAEWARAEEVAPFALTHGYEFHGAWELMVQPRTLAFVWRKPDRAEFFCQYQAATKVCYDLVSILGPELGLTTASSKDAFTLPSPPGAYTQAFHGAPLDHLWQRHQEARAALEARFGWAAQDGEGFETHVRRAIKRQTDYIRRLPLWALRGTWWYFVVRERKKDRPITDLYDLSPGTPKLPRHVA
jgi:hypothetical protein